MAIRVRADGTIDARGDARGANGHMCSLTGDRLRFDRSTGWHSGPYQANGDEPAQWRRRPMPVLLLWSDRAEIWRNGHNVYGPTEGDPRPSDYASCGARAGFGQMLRVPVAQAEAARRFEALGEPY